MTTLLELAQRLAALTSVGKVAPDDAAQAIVGAIESIHAGDAAGAERVLGLLSAQYDRINDAEVPYRLEYARLVAATADRLGFPRLNGCTHHDLGKLLNKLGRPAEAKAAFEKAIAAWGDAFPEFADVARGDLGRTLRQLGEFAAAEPLLRHALDAAIRAGQAHNELQWRLALGYTLAFTSRNREANEMFRVALEGARRTGDVGLESDLLTGLANVCENEGRYDECIAHHRAALARSRQVNDVQREGVDHLGLGNLFLRLGRFDEARASYQAAHALAVRANDLALQGLVASAFGGLLLRAGDPENAEDVLMHALRAAEQAGDRYTLSRVLSHLGHLAQLRGDLERAHERHLHSFTNSTQTDDVRSAAQDLVNLTRVTTLRGDVHRAAGYASVALELAERVADPFITYAAEHCQARALVLRGNGPDAVVWGHYQRAMSALEAPRAFVADDADRIGVYGDGKHLLYEEAVTWLLDRGSVDAALATAERAKSRLLLDGITERVSGTLSEPLDAGGLRELMERMGVHTVCVSLFVTAEETLAFVFGGGRRGVDVVRRPVAAREWEAWVEGWRACIHAWQTGAEHPGASRPRAEAMLAELDDMLMRDVRASLQRAGRVPHVRLLPHRVLHAVPLHAAYDRETQRYLAEGLFVSYLPGLQLLMEEPPGVGAHRALVVSAPTTTLGPLAHAEPEARLVESLFGGHRLTGEAATVEALTSRAGDATLIHLSCHAEFDDRRPELSSFVLAGDERLTTQQISQLACRDLELVVSAACGSGRNRPAAVDEPVGLSRAWLLSGARVVLGMLWEVGDEASYRFMNVFYRRLHAGVSHAEAYWHAQRELLSGDAFDRDGRYWGAFALTSRTYPTSGREPA